MYKYSKKETKLLLPKGAMINCKENTSKLLELVRLQQSPWNKINTKTCVSKYQKVSENQMDIQYPFIDSIKNYDMLNKSNQRNTRPL